MKKLTRKITLSLVAILFAVIALGTTTYAWFTLGSTASVGNVEADVTAGEGIEVSLDGKTWVNNLTTEMIQAYINENYGEGKTNASLKLVDLAKAKDTLTFTNSQKGSVTETSGSFLKLPIKVRAVGAAVDKAVNVTKVTMKSDEYKWTSDVTVLKAGVDYNKGVAISDETHLYPVTVKNGEDKDQLLYFAETDCDLVAGKEYNYFACDAARVTFAYKNTVKLTTYSSTDAKGVKVEEGATTGSLTTRFAAAKGYTFTATLTGNEDDTTNYKLNTEVTAEAPVLVIPADELTTEGVTVDVYVWLNGFDADCINAILNKKVSISFEFSLAK